MNNKEGVRINFRPKQYMIEVNKLCKTYRNNVVLKDITCSFDSGHVYSIIAPNGTGKTTFINIISGLVLPTSGKVTFSGHHSIKDTYVVLAGEKNLYAKNTVKENATYIGRISGRTTDEIKTQLNFLRKRFHMYDEIFNALVEKLSYGQKRLVALLNSVIANSSCIIIDEASEGLDMNHISLLTEMIDFLKKDRIIILASHDYEFVANISDFNWFLKNGYFQRMYGRLSKDQLVNIYSHLYTGMEA